MLLEIDVLPLSHVQPEEFIHRVRTATTECGRNYKETMVFFPSREEGSQIPVEEGLPALAVKPAKIVELEVVAVPVPGIDLQNGEPSGKD